MILLSHEQRCSLVPTNVRHDADRLHPLRCTESDRDLPYLIRTLLRFSAQRECGLSSPTSSAACRKPGSAQSAPTVPAAGCRRRIGCTPRREGSGRPSGDVSRRRSWQDPHARRAGSRIPGALWRQQRQDGAALGLAAASPIGSRRLVTLTSSSRWRSARQNPRGRPCGCWDVASHLARAVLVQPIFALVVTSRHVVCELVVDERGVVM